MPKAYPEFVSAQIHTLVGGSKADTSFIAFPTVSVILRWEWSAIFAAELNNQIHTNGSGILGRTFLFPLYPHIIITTSESD